VHFPSHDYGLLAGKLTFCSFLNGKASGLACCPRTTASDVLQDALPLQHCPEQPSTVHDSETIKSEVQLCTPSPLCISLLGQHGDDPGFSAIGCTPQTLVLGLIMSGGVMRGKGDDLYRPDRT
jgi:hypothetical protein